MDHREMILGTGPLGHQTKFDADKGVQSFAKVGHHLLKRMARPIRTMETESRRSSRPRTLEHQKTDVAVTRYRLTSSLTREHMTGKVCVM